MGGVLQGQVHEIAQGKGGPPFVEHFLPELPPQDGDDLEVDDLRSGELFAAEPVTGPVPIRPIVGQGYGENAGINDQHDLPGRSRLRPGRVRIRQRVRRPGPRPRPMLADGHRR